MATETPSAFYDRIHEKFLTLQKTRLSKTWIEIYTEVYDRTARESYDGGLAYHGGLAYLTERFHKEKEALPDDDSKRMYTYVWNQLLRPKPK